LTAAAALLDSNVIIAIVAEAHEHHATSLALVTEGDAANYAVSARSYAEAYSTLTCRGDQAGFHFGTANVSAALASLRAITKRIGLTPAQTFDVVRAFGVEAGYMMP
jgi:uncharacterized protein with PIN domain